MKKKLMALAALLALGLSSCNDEEMISSNPHYVGNGEAVLRISMGYSGAQTRALGDKIEIGTKEEKTISSVAFIVKTETETVDEEERAGAINYFLSEEDLMSANGLTEPLELQVNSGDSIYTCQIKVKSDGWGTPKVLVIANYKENGVDIPAIVRAGWDKIPANLVSATLTANPNTPLLMYGHIDDLTEWTTNGGGEVGKTIKMERLVSRIDIRNNAYNAADAGKGFTLSSARLVNAKQYAYIMKGANVTEDMVKAIPVAGEFPLHTNVVTDGDIQKLDTLYTYENPNADPLTATAIQVNGTFRGARTSKLIKMKYPDKEGGVIGDPIALTRNTRYIVNINPAKDSLDIDWTITVKDWTEADTITIRPSYTVPVIEDMSLSTTTGATIDGKVVTIDDATFAGTELTFRTSAPQASSYAVDFAYDTKAASIGGPDGLVVEQGAPVLVYSGAKVTREYRVTIPAQTKKVPMDAYIIIRNGSYDTINDTITVRYLPNYDNTTIKPVLYKGQYWAPVNVGATKVPTSVSTTWSVVTCGYYYQWGRNVPLSYRPNNLSDVIEYPNKTYAEIIADEEGIYTNKFIKGLFSESYTWFSDYKGEGLSSALSGNEWPRENQPCPAGWRIPTKVEFDRIVEDSYTKKNGMVISSTNSEFILPMVGIRSAFSGDGYGTSINMSFTGYYWGATLTSGKASQLYIADEKTIRVTSESLACGCPIRCIQE
ncbi:hypothetical protein [Parabacteroides bouchesdurhonensis]|uniref:hypothetical protein n=1 Tax=Parabacteroides bouchesdurhonensis TaxID=1936995 RepID=UPI00164E0909|nr:hypothetical protein [Parabacteroides bouchesdurhonensis]